MLLRVPQVPRDRCNQKLFLNVFFLFTCPPAPALPLLHTHTGPERGRACYSPIPWQVSQVRSLGRSRDARSRSCSKLPGEEAQTAPAFGTDVVGGKGWGIRPAD